jgi:hypothetical protein
MFNGMVVSLAPVNAPQTFMSVQNMGTNNGTKLVTWTAMNGTGPGPAQVFRIQQRPDGRFSLRPLNAPHMAVDMTGKIQQHIHLWQGDDNNANQGWSIEPHPGCPGNFMLRTHLGAVLDCDLGQGGAPGSKVHTWPQTGAPNQAWNIRPDMNAILTSPGFPQEGTLLQLFPANAPQTCMSLNNQGTNNGTQLVTWGDHNAPSQRFCVHRRPNGSISLHPVSCPNMAVDMTGQAQKHIHIWQADDNNMNQCWWVAPGTQAGTITLRCHLGTLLDCDLGTGGAPGSKIHTWPQTGAPNQNWRVEIGWS